MSGIGNSLGREAIYSAFYAQVSPLLLAPAGSFNYTGRRPVVPTGLGVCQYPAAYFVAAGEIYDRTVLKAPAKVTLMLNLVVDSMVATLEDESCIPDLNNLADEVEAAIQSACDVTAQNILGGLVQEAWINHRNQIILPAYGQSTARQIFMVELILPHSR